MNEQELQELENISDLNNVEQESETAKFRKKIPFEILENKKLRKAFGIKIPPRQLRPKIGRNEKCPCGSDKKFKHCCINYYEREYLY